MPPWLRDFLGRIAAVYTDAVRYIAHSDSPWENWVDQMIHRLWRMTLQSYVINTWSLANFSYFVASFTATSRAWTEWLAYQRIPNAVKLSEFYAFLEVRQEREWRRAAIDNLDRRLVKYITIVALNLASAIHTEVVDRRAAIDNLRAKLTLYIDTIALNLAQRIQQETDARKAAIADLTRYVNQQVAKLVAMIRAILPAVDKEAADGYNAARPDQSSVITSALTDVLKDAPAVRELVGKLVGVVLDLAVIDDPLARLAAKLVLTEVIDRLGVDKLAGGLINDLLGAFLGMGPPKTLADVETQTAQRLAAGERQWQQFYANGGDDLENLGHQMRESANPVFTALLAGYFAASVADPVGTAAATDAVLTPAADAIVGPLLATLGAL